MSDLAATVLMIVFSMAFMVFILSLIRSLASVDKKFDCDKYREECQKALNEYDKHEKLTEVQP